MFKIIALCAFTVTPWNYMFASGVGSVAAVTGAASAPSPAAPLIGLLAQALADARNTKDAKQAAAISTLGTSPAAAGVILPPPLPLPSSSEALGEGTPSTITTTHATASAAAASAAALSPLLAKGRTHTARDPFQVGSPQEETTHFLNLTGAGDSDSEGDEKEKTRKASGEIGEDISDDGEDPQTKGTTHNLSRAAQSVSIPIVSPKSPMGRRTGAGGAAARISGSGPLLNAVEAPATAAPAKVAADNKTQKDATSKVDIRTAKAPSKTGGVPAHTAAAAAPTSLTVLAFMQQVAQIAPAASGAAAAAAPAPTTTSRAAAATAADADRDDLSLLFDSMISSAGNGGTTVELQPLGSHASAGHPPYAAPATAVPATGAGGGGSIGGIL